MLLEAQALADDTQRPLLCSFVAIIIIFGYVAMGPSEWEDIPCPDIGLKLFCGP
jgi:hypothetical protein